MIATEPRTDPQTEVDLAQRVTDLEARLADLFEWVASVAEDLLDRTTEPA